MNSLPPVEKRLTPDDRFRFECSERLACFNRCCRNKDIVLTPYDILRLRQALKLHSDAFLERCALYRQDPVTGFPVISLKMNDDSARTCPFVSAEGCTVYKDRPTACRLYPLARAVGRTKTGGAEDEFFFLLDTPACLGVREERPVRLGDWLEEQGVGPYLEINNRMLSLLHHKGRDPAKGLQPDQLQKVIFACYNLDAFREFLFRSDFLDRAGVDENTRAGLRSDDEQLLLFGFDFLVRVLF